MNAGREPLAARFLKYICQERCTDFGSFSHAEYISSTYEEEEPARKFSESWTVETREDEEKDTLDMEDENEGWIKLA